MIAWSACPRLVRGIVTLSTLDVVSQLAELCTLVGELLVVGLTLWLLYRVVESAQAFDQPTP
jgi:hypothetical protein